MANSKATVGIPNVTADGAGNLNVNVQAGGGGGGLVQIEDTNGNPLNSNGSGALNVAVVSGGGSNASVGATGTTAPTSATEIGVVDNSGNLRGASSTFPVRIDPVGTTPQPITAASLPLPSNAAQETGGNLAIVAGAVSSSVMQDNVKNWGGTAVAAASTSATAGTDSAPITRSIQRKYVDVLTTTPLGISGVFTSSWIDTQQTGESSLHVWFAANVTGSISIQGQDDSSAAPFVLASQTSTISGVYYVPVPTRYWRIVYTNGGTAQSSFELTAAGSSTAGPPMVHSPSNGWAAIQGGSASAAADGTLVAPQVNNPLSSAQANSGATNIICGVNNTGTPCINAVVPFAVTDGTTGGQASAIRTPNVFKTVQIGTGVSGNQAVWTPTSGKKFRLMGYAVFVSENASIASGAVVTLQFSDASSVLGIAFDTFIPTTAVTTIIGDGFESGPTNIGNGILSAAANNVLNLNVGVALATGTIRVNVWGTEE